ncbi:hypothetical protein [Endozoicomonas sp. ALD040]
MNEAMINPEIVHWARERAGMAPADLARRKKDTHKFAFPST